MADVRVRRRRGRARHSTTRSARRWSAVAVALTIVSVIASLAGPAVSVASASAAPSVAPVRYADSVFTDVAVTTDVEYGAATGANGTTEVLKLDLYEPAGDTLAARPAIVYIHGGWFAFGDKSEGSMVATELARHGYVVVSIDYRLYPGDLGDLYRLGQAEAAAALDAKAAVRWLRSHAAAQRVDPRVIGAIGYSAGALTSLNVNYGAYTEGTSGNPGLPSDVEAAVSLSGFAPYIRAGRPPVMMFHGDQDSTVPYTWAVKSCNDSQALGNACELVTYPGIAHNIYDRYDDWMPKTVAFYFATLVPLLSQPVAARYHAITPTRVLDSRTGTGGWPGTLVAGVPRELQVSDVAGVPAGASAAVFNVTVTGGSDASFLTVRPAGAATSSTSNLNFAAGQTIANLVTVKMDAAGKVSFANAVGAVDVVADLVGYYDYGVGAGELFDGIAPVRLLDSRTPTGGWNTKLVAGKPRDLAVRQPGNATGVPATATTVVVNITATNATAGSYISVWPSGSSQPAASTLNFGAGQTIPNLAIVKVGSFGWIRLANAVGAVDVIVDVVGYFDPTTGARFHPLEPTRVLDDRTGTGLTGPWGPGQTRVLPVAGAASPIPADATGLVANVTATAASAPSYLTVYPNGAAPPPTSNLNFAANETIANLVMVKVGDGGSIAIANQLGTVDVVADAVGYYAPT